MRYKLSTSGNKWHPSPECIQALLLPFAISVTSFMRRFKLAAPTPGNGIMGVLLHFFMRAALEEQNSDSPKLII